MNLNTLKPADGSRPNRNRVGRGIGSVLVKLVVVDTKAKNRAPVVITRLVLKVVKCLCKDACLKLVSVHVKHL